MQHLIFKGPYNTGSEFICIKQVYFGDNTFGFRFKIQDFLLLLPHALSLLLMWPNKDVIIFQGSF